MRRRFITSCDFLYVNERVFRFPSLNWHHLCVYLHVKSNRWIFTSASINRSTYRCTNWIVPTPDTCFNAIKSDKTEDYIQCVQSLPVDCSEIEWLHIQLKTDYRYSTWNFGWLYTLSKISLQLYSSFVIFLIIYLS